MGDEFIFDIDLNSIYDTEIMSNQVRQKIFILPSPL